MTNDINFDKSKYIELLKKGEILKNQGTSLFNENREENLELLSYNVILENQIYYNRKTEHIFLVKEYLEQNAAKDGAILFRWKFLNIFREDNKALQILKKKFFKD